MNVNIWGPPTWEFLHNAAFLLDSHKQETTLFLHLNQLLPCMYCRDSYVKFYKQLKKPEVGMYSKWIYMIHKLVNQKLNSQRISKIIENNPQFANLKKIESLFLVEPSELVLKKRFMVNREEPISFRAVSTMLLAFSMAAQTQDLFNILKNYCNEVAKVLELSPGMQKKDFVKSLINYSSSEEIREALEKEKYKGISVPYSNRQLSELIRAHTCFEGSCV